MNKRQRKKHFTKYRRLWVTKVDAENGIITFSSKPPPGCSNRKKLAIDNSFCNFKYCDIVPRSDQSSAEDGKNPHMDSDIPGI